jgi:hypothetical protein
MPRRRETEHSAHVFQIWHPHFFFIRLLALPCPAWMA